MATAKNPNWQQPYLALFHHKEPIEPANGMNLKDEVIGTSGLTAEGFALGVFFGTTLMAVCKPILFFHDICRVFKVSWKHICIKH